MIWIILAAALGANFIVIALLFRRMRHNLNRQLSDMRAERNSEWILHALQGVPDERAQPARAAVSGGHTPPLTPRPDRRKKHLRLYNGGGAVAAIMPIFGLIIRCTRQAHNAQLAGLALGTTAAAATAVTVMTVAPWQQDIQAVMPTGTPTTTAIGTPGSAPPAGPEGRGPTPGASSTAAPATPSTSPGTTPPSQGDADLTATDQAGEQKPSGDLPQEEAAPAPATSPTAVPLPSQTTPAANVCVTVLAAALHACIAGGG